LIEPVSRIFLLAVLFVGLPLVVLGCAQGLQRNSPTGPSSGTVQEADPTARLGEPGRILVDSLPSGADSLAAAGGARMRAFGAAEVDPGMLLYTEPPPGTNTPVFTPPDSVDPGMIWRPRP
jgi:hypothetical protein